MSYISQKSYVSQKLDGLFPWPLNFGTAMSWNIRRHFGSALLGKFFVVVMLLLH